jgi:hypothetical protein
MSPGLDQLCRGSTITVAPRLLIKNPAMPSHRRSVPSLASKAFRAERSLRGSGLTLHGETISRGWTSP